MTSRSLKIALAVSVALNVFAVPQMHAVSTVAPFAGGPRYSVTGWWRAKPLER